jgi:hypothetical protein
MAKIVLYVGRQFWRPPYRSLRTTPDFTKLALAGVAPDLIGRNFFVPGFHQSNRSTV